MSYRYDPRTDTLWLQHGDNPEAVFPCQPFSTQRVPMAEVIDWLHACHAYEELGVPA